MRYTVNTRLTDLPQGKWVLIRNQCEMLLNSDDVTHPTYSLIKYEDNGVTMMDIFITQADEVRTVGDWVSFAFPEVSYLHNNLFSYHKDLAKYSLDSMTIHELQENSGDIFRNDLVDCIANYGDNLKQHLPYYDEVKDLAKIYEMKYDDVMIAIIEALKTSLDVAQGK